MTNSLKDFQRKIRNRQFSIDNSWRGNPDPENQQQADAVTEEQHLQRLLNENIREADGAKYFDGYLPIFSERPILGKSIIFCKRALRKVLKIFFGWYIFPFYERLSHFHGKVVNAISLQRDFTTKLHEKIWMLSEETIKLNKQTVYLCEETAMLREQVEALLRENKTQALQMSSLTETNASLMGQFQGIIQRLDILTNQIVKMDERHIRNMNVHIEALRQEHEDEQKMTRQYLVKLDEEFKKIQNIPTDDDEFYHCFEEKFRGPMDEIRDRLRIYIPLIQHHLPDWSQGRFIDVGSGRGEWLDILKENGAQDYVGVDLNERQNVICTANGHTTVCMDCISYLMEQPENSVNLITGFQIIEHLFMSDLMELLRQCYRTLKQGGMILFETQNPRNLIVGADTFYIDPSHKRPLAPEMVEFFVEWSGFKRIQCIDVNSCANWTLLSVPNKSQELHELFQRFNDVNFKLFGPQDYAVFAMKE